MHSAASSALRHRVLVMGLLLAPVSASGQAPAAEAGVSKPARASREVPADSPAAARQGMWLSAGLGAGSAALHCRICDGEQQTRGTTGYVRVGTTLNSSFLLGAEVNGWMRSDQSGKQRVYAVTGNAYWYPNPRHAYYIKGGFGMSGYRQWSVDEDDAVTTALTSGGFTGHVGAGYEVRVNPRMSIVPYVNLIGSARGTLATERDDGTHFDRDRLSARANVLLLQLGLGVTWH